MVLAYHTKSTRYLQKTIKATTRFDLDGNPAEPLEETHKTHAEEMLKERAKNNAERAKAEAKLKREQQAAAEEAEKLQREQKKSTSLRRNSLSNYF
jgi:ProP effector